MNTAWQSFLFPAGTGLQLLGLALVVGGMLALGAFTAPVVFRSFPHEEAGAALTTIFRRYDKLLLAAMILILLGETLRLLSGSIAASGLLNIIRWVLLAALTAGLLFSIFKVNADLEAMQKAGVHRDASPEGLRFNRTHKLSENLYKWEMTGAVLLILLTPFVTSRLP